MTDWWNALDDFEKALWAITLIATLIFVIQTIATFIGMDGDSSGGADFDGDMSADASGGDHDGMPFQLFTFRNFINFFLGFGWTVISMEESLGSRPLALLVGVVVGVALVTAVMYMFYYMGKLAESGNMDIKNALNKTAQVYLTIPAAKSGMGKIQIQIQGSLHEMDAITEGDSLPTGSVARVKEIIDDKLLLVEKA